MRPFILISVVAGMYGCEVIADTETVEEANGYLVVEGQITNERTLHTVVLTASSGVNWQAEPPPVSNASLTITDGQTTFAMTEAETPGVYKTVDTLQGKPGKIYTLEILVGGKRYIATDTMPEVPVIRPLAYAVDDESGGYTWNVPNEHSLRPGTTYETHVRFIHPTKTGDTDTTQVTYYNFTGLNASALFSLNEMSRLVRFTKGTIIVQRRYRLSDAYYKFLKALYLETDWRGGLYDIMPANAPTNVTGGALGFFRASSVSILEQRVE